MFERIVIPLDGSCLAEWGLPHAISLSKAFNAQLVLVRVINSEESSGNGYPPDPITWEALRAESSAYLDTVASRLGGLGLKPRVMTLEGEPVDQIIDFVRRDGPTLLVMTSHGIGGHSHYMLGSVVHKSVLHAHVSFLLVRAFSEQCGLLEEQQYTRLLVPLDGSKRAECVLTPVEALARADGSDVLLVSVVESLSERYGLLPQDERRMFLEELEQQQRVTLERYQNRIRERWAQEGLRVEGQVVSGQSPIMAVWNLTRKGQVDLVVMAAHGHSGINHWPLGALPLNALIYGETPLLVIQDLEPNEIKPTRADEDASEVWGH
ncbi:universal stress protein [Marinobacter caseinilyticus]|uniref:universal stress protein n=1 Tax=Marinobacter caseinilyticus TaxID=2692195 RepID=UPI001409D674|nr:universal stress protein [Marinobacter caseinilyticus]